MKNLFTILALTVIFSVSASAAKSYQGYVVLNNDEKVEGTIQMLSPTLNEVKVKFTSTAGQKVTYKSNIIYIHVYKYIYILLKQSYILLSKELIFLCKSKNPVTVTDRPLWLKW